ncbi:aspartate kinase [Actinospongicola halichondriae]|uniref:aspartate kinase n=1 Tax=Actinospongicola halichondriae TaxID=3236844 RepID=UPI003D5C2FB9
MTVQKFGGTSVADPDRIREVADHAVRTRKRGTDVVLVVSAMGKETDHLLRLAEDVSRTKPSREMDMLITAGERKAMALVAMAISDLGVPAQSFTGSQAGFITDTTHTDAKIIELRPERIAEAIAAGCIPVIGGSQGVSTDKNVTFLGRGGSDTTAVAIAHALGAEICELYTDVAGVYSADPRIVAKAGRMPEISFDELLEMTATGCPKPAMRSVEFARRHEVKLHIRSAFTWEPGTIVKEHTDMEQAVVNAVTHDTSEAKVTVSGVSDQPGIAARMFTVLAESGINVDMIVQNTSEHGRTDISFTVPHDEAEAATELINSLSGEVGAAACGYDHDIGRVSVVGAGMKSNPGVAAKMFQVLADNDINIEMISTSAIRISCVVQQSQVEDAVELLHTAFDLDV